MSDQEMSEGMIEQAAEVLGDRLPWVPELFGVLGSGLGFLADEVEDPVTLSFEDLPGFPSAGVEGHQGRYVAGTLEGRRVLLQSGRFHVYEGHPLSVVVAPVRVAAAIGIRTVLLTNAAGGVSTSLAPGDIMLISDHLNLQGRNPLMGPVRSGEPRFPDMSEVYDSKIRGRVISRSAQEGIAIHQGVYAALTGPSYETPAEVRMLRSLGADAVGMSTVPEAIVARARGMRVLGFSLITNHAAGVTDEPLSHEEVMEVGRESSATFQQLVRCVLRDCI